MSADQAAKALDVSRATLYAYVSRGLIRSEPVAHDARRHRYYAEDVRRLLQRKTQRREPSLAAEQALHFGVPVLTSALTLIDGERFYYRGQDVLRLASSCSVEEVAGLLWRGERIAIELPSVTAQRYAGHQTDRLPALERFQCALPAAATADVAAFDLRPATVMATGARILALMTVIAAGEAPERDIVHALARGWKCNLAGAERLLSAALILCADHELNVSSFTARCVASAGSSPYQVVLAGLAALQGSKHGGLTLRVESFLDEIMAPDRIGEVISARLRRGETVPGFGHPLYAGGDPRARLLLNMMSELAPRDPRVALIQAVAGEVRQLVDLRPTIDFALASLARLLTLPAGSALTIFALGRTIGWIAHAIEQYEIGQIIRPRARYSGPLPDKNSGGNV